MPRSLQWALKYQMMHLLEGQKRARKFVIHDDYLTYLSEDMDELVLDDDPTSF
jgi:hypothetical protein